MFRIGEFARLNRVSVRTLRHYEKVGLFLPEQVDSETGYRYYSANQISRLNRIILLKECGFSLVEIREVLQKDLTSAQMVEFLVSKRNQLLREIRKEQLKVARIEARLKILREEDTDMSYDVVIKSIQASKVAGYRDTIPNYEKQGLLWEELNETLKAQRIKGLFPWFAIYHDFDHRENGVDVEVVETVNEIGTDTERVKFKTLDAVPEMACVIHQGSYQTIRAAYNEISRWIEENEYQVAGPHRELYIKGVWNEADPEKWVTEIQIPATKKG